MSYLIDTNILLSSSEPSHLMFSSATTAISRNQSLQGVLFCGYLGFTPSKYLI